MEHIISRRSFIGSAAAGAAAISLAGKIDNAKMTSMNFQADGEGMEHAEIVRTFLIEEGIVEAE